ncbi:MAG: AAA family ATPase [Nanoarchaeota archaeon]
MKKIILIGGAPVAGKSYTARKIAEELKLPWISTDTIREQMRELVRKKDNPSLFRHSKATSQMALQFLTKNTAKEVVKMQNKESTEVWKGVRALINTDYVWGSFIIEGVAILPSFVANLTKKGRNIKTIFLIDEDIKRIRKTIFIRGLWDDADKYPNSIKKKEVEWVLEFNNFIKKEAKRYGFPVISIGNRKNYLKEIKGIISK